MENSDTKLSNDEKVINEAEKIVNNELNSAKETTENVQKKLEKNNLNFEKKSKKVHDVKENIEQKIEKKSEDLLEIPTIKPQNYNINYISNDLKTETENIATEKKLHTEITKDSKSSTTTISKINKANEPPSDFKKNMQKNPPQDTQKNPSSHTKKKSKTHTKSKSKKTKVILIIILAFVILVLGTLSFIFGFITSKSDKIISGVTINGIDVSNLNKNEAIQTLKNKLSPNVSSSIQLTHGDYTKELNPSDIGSQVSIEDSVNAAYSLGRSEGNIFANNFKVISTYFGKENVSLSATYNQEKLDDLISTINSELPDKAITSSYTIEESNLIVANSTSGYKVKSYDFSKMVTDCLINNKKSIEIPVERYEAEKVDIEAIYNEIRKDPVDATFTTNPYEVHKEEDGIDFAISLDEAKQIVSQDQESFTIPLKIIKPSVTVKNLPQEAFPDQLGTYSTSYATSNYNRSTNISLATQAVNGVVLMPGETFSYNGTVGQRTPQRGYKEAGVYVNGQVSTDYGGGICQVSSTLYNATLLANLEIVARTNHMFQPGYVPSGQDATVSWGAPDFQFKNNRNYPIKIVASADGSTIAASIYGLKTDDDYTVKIQSNQVGTIPFSTEYQDDSSLPAGTTKVLQGGSNGCRTETYKILYKNGTEVSRTRISSDTYQPHNQVVARGTATVVTPDPEPTTPATPTTPDQNTDNSSNNNTESNSESNSDESVTVTF